MATCDISMPGCFGSSGLRQVWHVMHQWRLPHQYVTICREDKPEQGMRKCIYGICHTDKVQHYAREGKAVQGMRTCISVRLSGGSCDML